MYANRFEGNATRHAAPRGIAAMPARAAQRGAVVTDLNTFIERRIPTLPPADEEHVVAMFRNRSVRFADAPRWRARGADGWRGATWRQNQLLVNELIAGLSALGVHQGERVAILSETRWEWLAADWAILGLGAVTVPLYSSLTADAIGYMLTDSGAEYAFVENQEQYEKLLHAGATSLKALIAFDPIAPAAPDDPQAAASQLRSMSFDDLRGLSGYTPEQAEELARTAAARIRPEDRASVIYTSGTTNRPKGVIHTHASLMGEVRGIGAALTTFCPGTTHLLWLPLAHVLGREEHLMAVDRGGVTLIAESIETLARDMREAQPNIIVSVPRIYEKAYAAIEAQAKGHGALQWQIFAWARAIGLEVIARREHQERLSLSLRLSQRLADQLAFRKVRAAFGGHLEFSITGGAPIAPELLRFFHAAGVLLLEGWGLTETMGAITVNRPKAYRLGSVGQPLDGHEIRIAPDGEALARGPCVFAGYLNNPAEDAVAFTDDGWLRTGDLGRVDEDGYVYITGRKKELIVTANGKKIIPDLVEAQLKGIEGVSQAYVYGDRKPYLVALLTLDPAAVVAWSARHGGPTDADAAARSPAFSHHLNGAVAHINSELARFETVKQFAVLPEDFTVENGLLTPTQKLRRGPIYAHYQDTVERLYTHVAPTPSDIG